MGRVTQYRCDPDLTEILVDSARPTLVWMRTKGIKFEPMYKGQSQKIDGRVKFFGGQICNFWGGGAELTPALFRAAEKAGIPVLYETTALSLIYEGGKVCGVVAESEGEKREIRSKAVVLACGGFEVERRDARALPRPRLRPRESARHAIQQRRAASRWRSTSARCPPGTGRARTPSAGTATRRRSATARSATASRSTATSFRSW